MSEKEYNNQQQWKVSAKLAKVEAKSVVINFSLNNLSITMDVHAVKLKPSIRANSMYYKVQD